MRFLATLSLLFLSVLSVAQPSVIQGRQQYSGAAFGSTTTAFLQATTRQTDLEIANATVDRARSYSCWVRFSNIRYNNQRVFNISNADNAIQQLNFFLIAQDNQTVGTNSKARFVVYTDNSNFMYIQSSAEILKNRYYHFAITYTGSEANTGLKLYINGVEDVSATRLTTGTYTGGINHADLRFKVGHQIDLSTMGGNIRDLAIWNRVLTSGEITQLFNSGVPRLNSAATFYSDIVADWPLQVNGSSPQNVNYILASTGVTYAANFLSFSTTDAPLSFRRTEIGNTRYVAFPALVRLNSTTARVYVRSGTTHLANGKIISQDINYVTGVASAPADRIVDATYDLRGGSAGIDDNGDIHVFSSRYNTGTDTFVDARHYVSTDGGNTFDAGEVFANSRPRFNFYGKVVAGFSAGEFFVPFFEHTSSTTFTVSVFKTTDNWATHSKIQVYDGTGFSIAEPAILNVGNNTLLMLCRQNNSPYGIYQLQSTDGGNTWSAPALTNLASALATGSNCDVSIAANGKLVVSLMDRSDDYAYVSKDNLITTILSDPLAWNTPGAILRSYTTDSLNILGYLCSLNVGNGNILVVGSLEFSSNRADLYFGIGSPY